MGQFLSQRSAHSAGPCSVWLWRLCSCNWCYWILLFLPRTSLREATQAVQILQGSALPVLPLAMIQHFNHPGPDQMEGGPPQAQIQVGTTARRAIVITGSPLWSPCSPKVTPPIPGGPPGWKRSDCEMSRASLVWKSATGVLPQFWGALGKASNFLLPPFFSFLDVQSNYRVVVRVVIEVEELQEVEGGDVRRKTSLADIIIIGAEQGDLLLGAWAYFSPNAVFCCFCFDLLPEPLRLQHSKYLLS